MWPKNIPSESQRWALLSFKDDPEHDRQCNIHGTSNYMGRYGFAISRYQTTLTCSIRYKNWESETGYDNDSFRAYWVGSPDMASARTGSHRSILNSPIQDK